MTDEVEQQQTCMRALRLFVDTLRDLRDTKDNSAITSVVVEAVRKLCGLSETPIGIQWHNESWQRGLVPTFQRLCICMTRLNTLEALEHKKLGHPTSRQGEKPTAPAGLLSLRDYSVLQAAVELILCWNVYPRVAAGVLVPIEKRRPTRTLKIAKTVLTWGCREYSRQGVKSIKLESEETMNELLEIAQSLLQLLLLPQFQPILLPKYVVELLVLLVYGEVAMDTKAPSPVQTEFIRSQETLLRVLPLRMSMSSLRAALGQATPKASERGVIQRFKTRCGTMLSQLLIKDGGIVATIDMLLGGVEEGNTQAKAQVATLICQCPRDEDPLNYATALCTQVCKLLFAAGGPEKEISSSNLLSEMAVLLADQLTARHPVPFDTHILSVLFHPLLMYEDSRLSTSISMEDTSERTFTRCVAIAHLLLCGPPPSQRFLQALAPIIRPLLHMYAFAATSKSFLATPLRTLLVSWIRSCSYAALLLQVAVMPVTLPLQPSLLTCGYERKQDQTPWRPLREFCAGGSGGVSLRLLTPLDSIKCDKSEPIESFKSLIMPIVELLGHTELESCDVVGDLFVSLLLTYMHVRKNGIAETIDLNARNVPMAHPIALYDSVKNPTSADGIEVLLMLLVALIERLGPSVLRSANVVLQCIGAVLQTYDAPLTKLVDKEQQNHKAVETEDAKEEQGGEEILTICLGLAMTILEAGSSHRSELEEHHLCAMLPVLKSLSSHSRPEVAELASTARAHILCRKAATDASNVTSTESDEQWFDQILQHAERDLSSKLVPLRARGVVTLTKLVRRSHLHKHSGEWVPRVHALARVFLLQLHDAESYVYLAAIQGLAALADVHPNVAILTLVEALRDSANSLETRIKLSEALLFSARRCGETLPTYSKLFVYAYLDCIRPAPIQGKHVDRTVAKPAQLIQEVVGGRDKEATEIKELPPRWSSQELLAAATLRASCLSNLAEVCVLLQWRLQPFLLDVLTCVFGVLQLELELEATRCAESDPINVFENDEQQNIRKHRATEKQQRVVAVRRGAVFVLRYLVEVLGWKILELMPDQLSPLYRTLKHVAYIDRDRAVKYHATRALSALDEVMRAELFPLVEQQDAVFGMSSLRIV